MELQIFYVECQKADSSSPNNEVERGKAGAEGAFISEPLPQLLFCRIAVKYS